MNSIIEEKYKDVRFTKEQQALMYEILDIDKSTKDNRFIKVLDVYWEIGKRTSRGKGITKAELQEEFNISRKICDDIISILQGTTLIVYTEMRREVYWRTSSRGKLMGNYIKDIKGGKQNV